MNLLEHVRIIIIRETSKVNCFRGHATHCASTGIKAYIEAA